MMMVMPVLGGGVKEEEEETYISALKYQQNGEPF